MANFDKIPTEWEIPLNEDVSLLNPVYIDAFNKITAFSSVTVNETDCSNTYEFSYTNDAVNWTDWVAFSSSNISALVADSDLAYWFKIRVATIKITGSDPSVDLLRIVATQNTALNHDQPELAIFANIFDYIQYSDPHFALWCGNIKDKLIKDGIVPNFIERTEEYEEFWEAVSCFFALYYSFFNNEFVQLYDHEDNLREYLRQRGMFFCGDEDLTTLQGLANNFYKEIAKRGTVGVDDEVKRLLCSAATDWFMKIFIDPEDTGWNVSFTSPCYGGTQNIRNANMLGYLGPDINEVTDLSTLDGGSTVFSIVSTTDKHGETINALEIDMLADAVNTLSGIQILNSDPDWDTRKLTVDWNQTYVLEFTCIVPSGEGIPQLECAMTVTDENDNNKLLKTWFIIGATSQNEFDTNVPTGNDAIYVDETHYTFRMFVFGKNLSPLINSGDGAAADHYTDGMNLRFDSTGDEIKYVYPSILFKKTAGGAATSTKILVYNVRFSPAWFGQSESPNDEEFDYAPGGHFTSSSLIYNFWKNNGVKTEVELKRIVERYLYPAGTGFLTEFI